MLRVQVGNQKLIRVRFAAGPRCEQWPVDLTEERTTCMIRKAHRMTLAKRTAEQKTWTHWELNPTPLADAHTILLTPC